MKIPSVLQRLLDYSIYKIYKRKIIIGGNFYQWCDIPVPLECPKQSQTHPSIEFIKDGWNGATHWLGTTPYPDLQVAYENPCIYYANYKDSAPTSFTPIKTNPILPFPGGNKFNSDIDVFFHKNTLYALSREYDNENKHKEINVQKSSNGHDWSNPIQILYTKDKKEEFLSPTIIHYKDAIRIYALNGDAGIRKNGKCTGINIAEGSSLDSPDFKMISCGKFINKEQVRIEPWHFDLFQYDSKLYMIFCGRDLKKKTLRSPMETYLAVSENYQDFFIYEKPLIKHVKTYRPSAYIEGDTLYLYFSIVGDILMDGTDRRIGVTMFDFKKLISQLL